MLSFALNDSQCHDKIAFKSQPVTVSKYLISKLVFDFLMHLLQMNVI